MSWLEICSVVLSFVFLILLIKRNIWCWPFGILSSLLSAILFYQGHLYSESVLYVIYTVLGFYGWTVWYYNLRDSIATETVRPISLKRIGLYIMIGTPLALLLGYTSQRVFDNASLPYLDATTSTFGLIATFLEAHRYLSAWVFWIVLNLTTSVMYFIKGYYLYGPLMLIYFVFSIIGFITWRRLVVEVSPR